MLLCDAPKPLGGGGYWDSVLAPPSEALPTATFVLLGDVTADPAQHRTFNTTGVRQGGLSQIILLSMFCGGRPPRKLIASSGPPRSFVMVGRQGERYGQSSCIHGVLSLLHLR